MKLKSKPTRPVRMKDIPETLDLSSGDSLQQVVDWAKSFNVDFQNVEFECDGRNGGEYSYPSHLFKFTREETDDEFNPRMESYKKKFAAWQTWYDANKEEIDRVTAERKQKDEEQKVKRHETEIKRLQKQKEDTERQLKKLTEKSVSRLEELRSGNVEGVPWNTVRKNTKGEK